MVVARAKSKRAVQFMRDLDAEYRQTTGLSHRKHYSIFYAPPARSEFLMLNANPGGSPENYSYVDVMSGEHEYIEGLDSGRTTRNTAEILRYILATNDNEALRSIQVSNMAFRRSPSSLTKRQFERDCEEAKPFVAQLVRYVRPRAMLFAGNDKFKSFAKVHDGAVKEFPEETVIGPNGSHDAVYLARYELGLPYYGAVAAYTIYHPSRLNGHFRQRVLPLLRRYLSRFLIEDSS